MANERPPVWWVCSYPKSGNTWVRMLLFNVALRTGLSKALSRFDDLNPYFYQAVSPKPLSELNAVEQVQIRPAVILHQMQYQDGPLLVKSHYYRAEVAGLPVYSPMWCDKVLYVVRDPRDVACSFSDHLGFPVDKTIDLMAQEQAGLTKDEGLRHALGTWSMHVRCFREAEDLDVLVVRYEDLQQDACRELERMCEHLGIEVGDEQIEASVEACQFDNLKEFEERRGFKEKSRHQEQFFNEGRTARWRDELTEEQAERIVTEHAEQFREVYPEQEGQEVAV